ncbi:MAG: hypothetical protein RL026_741 [Pseudomonadota bacterium]
MHRMADPPPSPAAAPHPDPVAFAFVRELAGELSNGRLELPAFPDVVVRLRQLLADEFASSRQIERVISVEPALAAQLITMANSVAFNPSGPRIADLKSAITRVGLNMVRNVALAFAMRQMRQAPDLRTLREPLAELWNRSVQVAALSYVVARGHSPENPDTALLAGLLHGVGKLYVLTRARRHPGLFADPVAYRRIVRDWHGPIARAILENWDVGEGIVNAIGQFEDLRRQHIGPNDLGDVLTVANLMAAFVDHPGDIELNMQGVTAFRRMGLDQQDAERILADTAAEVASLRAALGE